MSKKIEIKIKTIEDKEEVKKKVKSINKHIINGQCMLIRKEKNYIIISDYVDCAIYLCNIDKTRNVTSIKVL